MQLLRDNLTLWTSDLADAAKDGDDNRQDWKDMQKWVKYGSTYNECVIEN